MTLQISQPRQTNKQTNRQTEGHIFFLFIVHYDDDDDVDTNLRHAVSESLYKFHCLLYAFILLCDVFFLVLEMTNNVSSRTYTVQYNKVFFDACHSCFWLSTLTSVAFYKTLSRVIVLLPFLSHARTVRVVASLSSEQATLVAVTYFIQYHFLSCLLWVCDSVINAWVCQSVINCVQLIVTSLYYTFTIRYSFHANWSSTVSLILYDSEMSYMS